MIIKPNRVNPVAKAMMQQQRRRQYVPDETKYNRKKDKRNADKDTEAAYQKGQQEST